MATFDVREEDNSEITEIVFADREDVGEISKHIQLSPHLVGATS